MLVRSSLSKHEIMDVSDPPSEDEGWWLLSVAEKCRRTSLADAWQRGVVGEGRRAS